MGFTNKNILANKNKKIIFLIIGIMIFFLGIILIFNGVKQNEKDTNNIKYLDDLIGAETDKLNQKTYLTVTYLSDKIAVYDNTTSAYYLAYDGTYYYVLFLKEEEANKLLSIDLENNPQRVEGITKSISLDVKNIFIEVLNEDIEDEENKIDLINFENILGDIYLDQTESFSGTSSFFFVLGTISLVTSAIIIIVNAINLIKYKSNISKLDSTEINLLESEMNSQESFYYEKIKLYLTPNYIIILNSNFKHYKYTDILWMYPYEHRTNGIRTNKAIKIHTIDGKVYMIANITINTKANQEIYDEIWKTIVTKNPTMKLGYTTENINYYKNVMKEIKNNKKNGI